MPPDFCMHAVAYLSYRSRATAMARRSNCHSSAAKCGSTPRSPPALQAMPTPRPVLLASDARAAPRQGSGRKHWLIRVEFNLGGHRNAVEVLVIGCVEGNDGEMESSLERWRDKGMQWKQGGKEGCQRFPPVHARPHTAHICRHQHHITTIHEPVNMTPPLKTPQNT